ncbi:hypothetical protein [Winogradskyella sp.]|uniref:hypothetical protein n=1 Tax=Winogradskyella sp. TaxID=1883156 RepID=UPI00262B696B|nr:hypothetical protein [Winogradskyella sp.]
MKKHFIILSLILFSCSGDDNNNPNCNFLFDAGVNLVVNTNLPQFNQLQNSINSVYVPNQGNSGIWLFRLNSSTLLAWDAADPSRPPSACSTLTEVSTGIVESGCEDGNQYSLLNGQGLEGNSSPCTLKPYRVDNLGNGQFLVTN